MDYRLAIFDFDGTLADSFGWFLDNINVAAARYGFQPMDLSRVDDYRGLGSRELIASLGLPLWKLPAVTAAMRRAMTESIESIRPFDGVPEVLAALREREVAIGVVSSNSRANIERVLGTGSAALIDHYGCGASLFGKRPLLRRIARAAGVAHGQVLCIGDELRDAEAAASLGMDFVGVAWGFATPQVLAARSVRAPFCTPGEILQAFGDRDAVAQDLA